LTNESFISPLENLIMNRHVSLALTIIRDAKLPAVHNLTDHVDGVEYRFTWGASDTLGYVQLDTEDADANGEAFEWIAAHPDLKIMDTVRAEDGRAEHLVIRLRDWRAANARRNAEELRVKIGKRRAEAHRDLAGTMPAAMHVDYHLGKVIQWEAERDCWKRIADRPNEFRAVLTSAVVDLITGLGTSADSLEDAIRFRQLTGLRSFVRRARVYMDAEDALDALLSF
jgi:hypothetical protein